MRFLTYPVLALLLLAFIAEITTFPINVTEIILGYGYPCENHFAATPDGWSLSLQRIPYGRNGNNTSKGVVFLQHGLGDSSAGYCLNSPDESLPYILADAGYDVWLGNNRGNGVSMINKYYTPDQWQFWDFSWDEMAKYDFPSQINYVLKYTGSKKLTYVGHSEGTIQAFAGLILDPSLASKLNVYIALAPVAYVDHQTVQLLSILARLDSAVILALLGVHEFSLPLAMEKLVPDICIIDPSLCDFVMKIITGPFTYLNASRTAYYLSYEPNPTSVKNMIHWSQGVDSQTFQMYDYGTTGNRLHYGQPTPPQYDLSKFPASLPVALFAGGIDALADPKDVEALMNDLPVAPMVHWEANYGHLDPLFGYNAKTAIYPRVLDLVKRYTV